MNALQYSDSPPWMTSPTSPSNSDNNVYASPALSPGSWNVISPTSVTNSNSVGGLANVAPSSVPSISSVPKTTHDSIGLPKELGNRADFEKDELQIRREKAAYYKTQKLMAKTFGACSDSFHAPVTQPSTATAKTGDTYYNKYERAEQIRREKIAKYKQQKLISESTGVSMSALEAPLSPTSHQTATTYNYSATSSMSPCGTDLIGSPMPPYQQHAHQQPGSPVLQSPVDEIGYSMSQTSISPLSTHLVGSPLNPYQQPADQQPQPALSKAPALAGEFGYPGIQAPMSPTSTHLVVPSLPPYQQPANQQPYSTVQTSPVPFDGFGYPGSQAPMSPTSTHLVGPPTSPYQQPLSPMTSSRVPVDDGGYAVRQAAIQRYKEKKRQAKYGESSNCPSGSEGVSMVPTSALFTQRPEQLATSTRKVKSDRPSSGVAKCQLDKSRQKAAQAKALRLLQHM